MTRYIDLTFPIHEGMTTFPTHWHPMVEVSQMGRHGIENRETRKLVMGTHTGTHCDAPRHFIPGGATIDQVDLDVFIGEAAVLDFSKVPHGTELGIDDLRAALAPAGKIPSRLIMRFDWDDHYATLDYYNLHPFLSEEAAAWLVEQGVRLLAMDTPQPDNPRNGRGCPKDAPNHKILLGAGVILVEYLCNLRQLKGPLVDFIALPLKIQGGDGAPMRCVAADRPA